MKNLYVFGNEYLPIDNLAFKVADLLKNVNIKKCFSPEVILESDDKEILILDAVKNIESTRIIDDVSKLKSNKMMSLHDFDLGFFLKLMSTMGPKRKIKIIGIPMNGNPGKIAKEVQPWL